MATFESKWSCVGWIDLMTGRLALTQSAHSEGRAECEHIGRCSGNIICFAQVHIYWHVYYCQEQKQLYQLLNWYEEKSWSDSDLFCHFSDWCFFEAWQLEVQVGILITTKLLANTEVLCVLIPWMDLVHMSDEFCKIDYIAGIIQNIIISSRHRVLFSLIIIIIDVLHFFICAFQCLLHPMRYIQLQCILSIGKVFDILKATGLRRLISEETHFEFKFKFKIKLFKYCNFLNLNKTQIKHSIRISSTSNNEH